MRSYKASEIPHTFHKDSVTFLIPELQHVTQITLAQVLGLVHDLRIGIVVLVSMLKRD